MKKPGGNDLIDRTKQFGVRVIRLVRALPRTVDARAVGAQLVRSGTSVGANYRAACRARSKREFIAKLGIVQEEADESEYWLELIIETDMLPAKKVVTVHRFKNGDFDPKTRVGRAQIDPFECLSLADPRYWLKKGDSP